MARSPLTGPFLGVPSLYITLQIGQIHLSIEAGVTTTYTTLELDRIFSPLNAFWECPWTKVVNALKVTRHLCFKNSRNLRLPDILACNSAKNCLFKI